MILLDNEPAEIEEQTCGNCLFGQRITKKAIICATAEMLQTRQVNSPACDNWKRLKKDKLNIHRGDNHK